MQGQLVLEIKVQKMMGRICLLVRLITNKLRTELIIRGNNRDLGLLVAAHRDESGLSLGFNFLFFTFFI